MRKFIDIAAHRRNSNYKSNVQRYRIAWSFGALLFKFSPRFGGNGARRVLLRTFGAQLGQRVRIHPSALIMFPWNLSVGDDVIIGPGVILYSLGKIVIGDNVLISQRAHLCAGDHDWRAPNLPLLTPAITIEPETWIGAEVFIGGGSHISRGTVCGARSVVFGRTAPGSIMVGNPAKAVRHRSTPDRPNALASSSSGVVP